MLLEVSSPGHGRVERHKAQYHSLRLGRSGTIVLNEYKVRRWKMGRDRMVHGLGTEVALER